MRLSVAIFVLPFIFLSAFSCYKSEAGSTVAGTQVRMLADAGGEAVTETETGIVEDEHAGKKDLASRIANSLDDRRLAAQVIISGIDGTGQLSRDMRILLTECPAGGIMLFRYNLDTGNDAIRNLIDESVTLVASEADVPPFVAVDHEGGTVRRFRRGVADLPDASSYGRAAQDTGRNAAIAQIAADSYHSGRAIKDLGLNLNFAPVAEYLHENNNDFLEDRSYGSDPAFVTDAAAAFITGMDLAGILCAVKHFPGIAGADPHLFSSALPGDRAALAELAAPFESLIRDGSARALMVAHTLVPAWDSVNIASLSAAVMDGWLRRELGFEGIIICDDFSMAAARSPNENVRFETAVVRSLAAGTDMVLAWPHDLRRTHREIQGALADGRLSQERLREAAQRIIFEKIRMGLIDDELRMENEEWGMKNGE